MDIAPENDLLFGRRAIADYLGVSLQNVRSLCGRPGFPAWREGKMLCARRSSISRWMVSREAARADRPAATRGG